MKKVKLVSWHAFSGGGGGAVPTATIVLKMDGKTSHDACVGDGQVDAAFSAIDRLTGLSGRLLEFSLEALCAGRDASGKARVKVIFDGKTFEGIGASTDIIGASIEAYLDCVNQYLGQK